MQRYIPISRLLLAVCLSAIPAQASNLNAPVLAILSDTDMVPTVYETGDLGPVERRYRDTLSILSLEGGHAVRSAEVSNSTNGPPGALALSRDRRFAFVAETYERRPEGATRLDQLRPGRQLRSIDIGDAKEARVVDSVEIGTQPQAIDLNPAGDLLVAMTTEADSELAFLPVNEGRFGEIKRFSLELPPSGGFIPLKSAWVQWHPSGQYIAVNLIDRSQVAFYEVMRDGSGSVSGIRPWGNRIQTNKFPFVGRFSPDGRFYVTSDLQWGVDTKGFFGVREGILTTVRLGETGAAGEAARHTVPHIAMGGWASETILFSPDGRFLVTSNLRGTGKADDDSDWTEQASLNLYAVDQQSGRLTLKGEWLFDAVQPQGLAFDENGSNLYVGVNRYRTGTGPSSGAVETWRLVADGTPRLEPTGSRVPLPTGVHTIVRR